MGLSIIVLFALIAVFVFVQNWRVGLSLVVGMACAGFFLFTTVRPHTRVNDVEAIYTQAEAMALPSDSIEAPELLPDIWKPGGIADQRPADLYPTRESAARGLGLELPLVIGQISPEKPGIIQVMGRVDNDLITLELLQALADGLRAVYPEGVEILVESDIPTASIRQANPLGVEVRLSTRLSDSGNSWASHNASGPRQWLICAGTLMADLTGSAGKVSRTATFKELLWLNDFSAYRALRGERWALARSSSACASREEAVDQALANLGERLSAWHPNNPDGATLAQAMRDREVVAADFVQRIEGESGPIWRAAILVKPEDVLQSVAPVAPPAEMTIPPSGPPDYPATTWAALFGLIGLVIVTGWMLKAMAYSGTGRPGGSSRHNALMLIWLVPLLGVALFLIMRLTTFAHR